MTASLHLASYSPREAALMQGRMLRHGPGLRATRGLAEARVCMLAELDTAVGGTPLLTRWGLLCGWEDPGARDEALGRGAFLAPFLHRAEESWSVSLDPVRVTRGAWRNWRPSTEGVPRLERDEPMAVMTHGRLRMRSAPAFTWHNRTIVRELAGNPAHTFRIGLLDHPLTRATFSLWRSRGEMLRFSYGDGSHNPAQRRALDAPWAHDWFFARFRLAASSGTWHGSDPLDALRARSDPAAG